MTENPYRDEIIGNLTNENFKLIDEIDEMKSELRRINANWRIYATRIQRIRALHEIDGNKCDSCKTAYPCDTIVLLDGLHD